MSEARDTLVRYDVAEQVATITLDSPHNRNALSRQLVGELLAALARADADPAATVVVLRAAGRVADGEHNMPGGIVREYRAGAFQAEAGVGSGDDRGPR